MTDEKRSGDLPPTPAGESLYRIICSYRAPADEQAFQAHYSSTHTALVRALPGLQAFTWGRCQAESGQSDDPFLVATLDWSDRASAQAALDSPAGQATVADVANLSAELSVRFQTATRISTSDIAGSHPAADASVRLHREAGL